MAQLLPDPAATVEHCSQIVIGTTVAGLSSKSCALLLGTPVPRLSCNSAALFSDCDWHTCSQTSSTSSALLSDCDLRDCSRTQQQ